MIKYKGKEYKLVTRGNFKDGSPIIELVDENYETYAIVSFFAHNGKESHPAPEGNFWLKNWSENEELAEFLIKEGIFNWAGLGVKGEFVDYRLATITSKGKRLIKEGNKFMKRSGENLDKEIDALHAEKEAQLEIIKNCGLFDDMLDAYRDYRLEANFGSKLDTATYDEDIEAIEKKIERLKKEIVKINKEKALHKFRHDRLMKLRNKSLSVFSHLAKEIDRLTDQQSGTSTWSLVDYFYKEEVDNEIKEQVKALKKRL